MAKQVPLMAMLVSVANSAFSPGTYDYRAVVHSTTSSTNWKTLLDSYSYVPGWDKTTHAAEAQVTLPAGNLYEWYPVAKSSAAAASKASTSGTMIAGVEGIFVYSVGTHAKCEQYAQTFQYMAAAGMSVICPEISSTFNVVEWVQKAYLATKWYKQEYPTHTKFVFTFGGHSGGGPVAQAAGYHAKSDADPKATIAGFVLQHPGAVPGLNVARTFAQIGPDRTANCNDLDTLSLSTALKAEIKQRCLQRQSLFPNDLFQKTEAPTMVICGAMCKVQGWYMSNWATIGWDTWTSSLIKEPSDCMISTSCSLVGSTFLNTGSLTSNGGGVLISTGGEHEHSVIYYEGLQEEGRPIVAPWLKYLLEKAAGSASVSTSLKAVADLTGSTAYPNYMIAGCVGDGWQQYDTPVGPGDAWGQAIDPSYNLMTGNVMLTVSACKSSIRTAATAVLKTSVAIGVTPFKQFVTDMPTANADKFDFDSGLKAMELKTDPLTLLQVATKSVNSQFKTTYDVTKDSDKDKNTITGLAVATGLLGALSAGLVCVMFIRVKAA